MAAEQLKGDKLSFADITDAVKRLTEANAYRYATTFAMQGGQLKEGDEFYLLFYPDTPIELARGGQSLKVVHVSEDVVLCHTQQAWRVGAVYRFSKPPHLTVLACELLPVS